MSPEDQQRLEDYRNLVKSPAWNRIKAELEGRLQSVERDILERCTPEDLYSKRAQRTAIKDVIERPQAQIDLIEQLNRPKS